MNYEKELFLMQQIYATLFSLNNKIHIKGDKAFENLSSRQYMTLLTILHLPANEATLNSIAKKMGTSRQNVNQLISVLGKKKFIETKPSEKDKRAVNINVTESGFQEMVKCGEAGIMFMADLFNDFTEDELNVLWDLLKKLYRFDGIEQDGFEAEVTKNDEVPDDEKQRVLNKFYKRRKNNLNIDS